MIERGIKADRTFFLGQYKNIKISDALENIPENIAMNKEVMDELYYLLLITIEYAYRRYQKLNLELGELSLEDSISLLNDLMDSNLKSIKELLKDGKNNSQKGD